MVVYAQCGRGGVNERMGVLQYTSSHTDNRCNWVFQPPKDGKKFVFILKFFDLDQGIADRITIPNGMYLPEMSSGPSNM